MKKLLVALMLCVLCLGFVHGKEIRMDLKASKFEYSPNIITVEKGDVLVLNLIATDVAHGFYLDGYEISAATHPGENRQIVVRAEKAGRFNFRCSLTCGDFHPYMVGYLKVTPNTNLAAGFSLVGALLIGSLAFTFLRKGKPSNKLFGLVPVDWRLELTKFKPIRKLFKSRWFPFIFILVNLFFFTVILIATITGGYSSGNYNFGIMFVWILWWVLLMLILVPGFGRIWCMMCPFPMFGDWLQRRKLVGVSRKKPRGMRKKWPKQLRNMWPLTILFFVTTFFSAFFTVKPLATFILLTAIIGAATVLALIYEKRTFCLYFCPVSGFQGLYANFSAAEVRVKDPEICAKHVPKTCVVGNENGYGCPWLEQPFEMNRNTYCGMCMECFKSCPHDNMAFNIRAPGVGLLEEPNKMAASLGRQGLDEAFKGLTMMGIMIVFFLTMQGPIGLFKDMVKATTLGGYFTFLSFHLLFTFVVIPGMYLLFVVMSKLMSGDKEKKIKEVFSQFSLVFVPIGLAIWAAFSIGIIFPNGSYLLHVISDPFAWGWNLFGTADIPWTPVLTGAVPYLQLIVLLAGLVASLGYSYRTAWNVYGSERNVKKGWVPIALYLSVIFAIFTWLFLG